RQYVRKTLIDPINQRLGGAEVAAQAQGIELHVSDALLRKFQKGPHLRLPKTINGLHGVTDAKHAASIAALPAGGQQLQEFELRAGRILEFIDQNMLQPIVEP